MGPYFGRVKPMSVVSFGKNRVDRDYARVVEHDTEMATTKAQNGPPTMR